MHKCCFLLIVPAPGVPTLDNRMRALALWKLATLITRSTEISGQSVQQMIVERLEISIAGQGLVIPVV